MDSVKIRIIIINNMKSVMLLLVGAVSYATAQSAIPKWTSPVKAVFTELTAYNLPGYTTKQLWDYRNVERIVKFDTTMNCYYEAFKSNGVEQSYDAYCWSKEVHWKANTYPQCTQASRSVNVADSVKQLWAYYDQFSVHQGVVADPFLGTAVQYYRNKHATQNRWIWFRTSDKAIVFEQYYDGTQQSWVKYFEGGILTNNFLFTSDFRIPKCSNPFLAAPALHSAPASFLSEPVPGPVPGPVPTPLEEPPVENEAAKVEVSEMEQWIFDNYDLNNNGKLSNEEAKELLKDIENYDFTSEKVPVEEIDAWFARWDTNKDGQLSVEEFFTAIQ
jgi:predicted transcriptional regulator